MVKDRIKAIKCYNVRYVMIIMYLNVLVYILYMQTFL